MRTTFSLRFRGMEEDVARDVAHECFSRIDLIESRLSRYVEGSDISQINRLAAGQTLYISEECHECLLAGIDALARTGGLFDITLGRRIQHRKDGSDGPPPPDTGRLTIHPDVAAVTCEQPGRELDLGGIGKGYALDHLKRVMMEWEVEDALICAGASSLLAIGPNAWPVDLAGRSGAMRVMLGNASISASGTGIQGEHIVHPGGADAMPAAPCERIWTCAGTAVMAEIWSTALMLLDPVELPAVLTGIDELTAVYAERGGRVEKLKFLLDTP
jgi:thiamine biosynthesis lipoprotein